MLLLIALMIGGIFSLMFAHMLWQEGLLPFFKPAPVAAAPTKAATTAPAAKPAAAAPGAAPASRRSHSRACKRARLASGRAGAETSGRCASIRAAEPTTK